jgi:hypothetical protein
MGHLDRRRSTRTLARVTRHSAPAWATQTVTWAKPCVAGTTYILTHRSTRFENDRRPSHGRSPVWTRGPTRSRTARNVPRASTNARAWRSLFGGPTWSRATRHSEASWRVEFNAVSGRIVGGLQAHTTSFAADPQPACHSTRPDNDHEPTHGRSPVWRVDQTTHAPLVTTRERSRTHAWAKPCLAGGPDHPRTARNVPRRRRTHAWAKPCLAGRPTGLVRTQCCETHTSRGRPSGMELPDYPVMATLPTPMDQDGPALLLPAGSFPVLVSRSASRRFPIV